MVTNESTTKVDLLHSEAFCPYYQQAVELIGRKWTGAILRAQLHGVVRFSELRAAIPAMSDRMLSERLKELETEEIVVRQVIPAIPVRVEYHLTPKGQALGAVVEGISAWAHEWLELEQFAALVSKV